MGWRINAGLLQWTVFINSYLISEFLNFHTFFQKPFKETSIPFAHFKRSRNYWSKGKCQVVTKGYWNQSYPSVQWSTTKIRLVQQILILPEVSELGLLSLTDGSISFMTTPGLSAAVWWSSSGISDVPTSTSWVRHSSLAWKRR